MDYSTEFDVAEIIASVIAGATDSGQQERLSVWLAESEENRELFRKLTEGGSVIASKQQETIDLDEVVGRILSRISTGKKAKLNLQKKRWLRVAAAACIVSAAGLTSFLALRNEAGNADVLSATALPPASKVRIVLGTGEEIAVDDTKEDMLTADGYISRDGESLVVSGDRATTGAHDRIDRIITEAGGEIHFMLSDGTKVWLNAGSELSFPFRFDSDERRVFLSGEAYFEVVHNKDSPFIVVADKMNIRVLGTTFNIKAYADDPRIVTTLVSGSVLVTTNRSKMELKPGMAAELDHSTDEVQVHEADVRLATAWIDGYFMFRDETLDAITRTLARWYDVKFVFEDSGLERQIFNGRIKKYGPIKETLDRITLAGGPAFSIEKEKIYVK